MKKLLFLILPIVLLTVSVCSAELRIIGKGDAMRLDPSSFPPPMKANYEIMRLRCVKCHTLERTIIAIQSGIAPITGQPFDKNATKAYGVKMLRKPDSNMTKQEVKATVELMNYLLEVAAHKGTP